MQERPEAVARDRLSLYLCAAPSPADDLLPLCASSTDTLLCQGFSKTDLLFLYNLHLVFTKCLLSWDFNSTLNSKYHFEKSFSFCPVYFHPCFPLIQSMAPISTANVRKASLFWTQPTAVLTWPSAFQRLPEVCSSLGLPAAQMWLPQLEPRTLWMFFSHELGNASLFHNFAVPQTKMEPILIFHLQLMLLLGNNRYVVFWPVLPCPTASHSPAPLLDAEESTI